MSIEITEPKPSPVGDLSEPPRSGPGSAPGGAVRHPERTGASVLARMGRDRSLLLMIVPGLLLLVAFQYIPLLGNVIAFQDYLPYIGISHSPFVGFANFQRLVDDPAFWQALTNTLTITVLQLVLFFPVTIALALLVHSMAGSRLGKFVQSVAYLPHFISWVIIVALFQQVLGGAGFINHFLANHNMGPISFMTNPDTFKLLVTAQVIWKDAGWATIIFLAALSTIDSQLYEASVVDGAGKWRRLWHITLPGIRPVIVLLLVLRLGEALSVGFEQIVLQRDAVGPASGEVLDTYVFYNGVQGGDWSLGAAAGLFKGVVGLILILAANRAAHALGEQGVYAK